MMGEIQVVFHDENYGFCVQRNFDDYASAYYWATSNNLKNYEIVAVLRPPNAVNYHHPREKGNKMTKYAIACGDGFLFEEIFDCIEEAQHYLERFYHDSPEDLEGCVIYEIIPKMRVKLPPMKPVYEEI